MHTSGEKNRNIYIFIKFLSKNTTEELKEAQTLINNDILLSDKMK